MSNKYEIAWKYLKIYMKMLPLIAKSMPVNPKMAKDFATLLPKEAFEIMFTENVRIFLEAMEAQEKIFGIDDTGDDALGRLAGMLLEKREADREADKADPIPPCFSPHESVPRIDMKDIPKEELMWVTEKAAKINYDTMKITGASRSLVRIGLDNGDIMGCLFVIGDSQLESLMSYAQSGGKMVYDSGTVNDSVGEN